MLVVWRINGGRVRKSVSWTASSGWGLLLWKTPVSLGMDSQSYDSDEARRAII